MGTDQLRDDVETFNVPQTPKRLSKLVRYYRYPLPVRIFHWVNALSVVLLLMSGLQIFNSYPRLHWGYVGNRTTPAVFEIAGNPSPTEPKSWIQIGSYKLDTTGILGGVRNTTFYGTTNVAFPGWMTLPTAPMDLGTGRAWHFLMIWVFFLNFAFYFAYGLMTRRFWREYIPRRSELRPAAVLRDIRMHLRLKRESAAAAAKYNVLQKLAYSSVLFALIPMIVLTGMTMSPSAVAAFPWLLELFNGRQTARTLHFIVAWLFLLFLMVHILQVLLAGFVNEMRSILTGYFVFATGGKE